MLRITDFHIPVEALTPFSHINNELVAEKLAAHLHLPPHALFEVAVLRLGLDARRRNGAPLAWVYQIQFALESIAAEKKFLANRLAQLSHISPAPPPSVSIWHWAEDFRAKNFSFGDTRPVVVGFGPAGMFAALLLARTGLKPLVLEQGADIETRTNKVKDFWHGKNSLSPMANVQFGEGGAGTFSDGKLTTRLDDPFIDDIVKTFIEFGAPPEIAIFHKPHLGTDRLSLIVKRIRQEIIRLGGEVRFFTKLSDLEKENSGNDKRIAAAVLSGGEKIKTSTLFLACGHSARDTYRMLQKIGIPITAKPFAIGLRIEHPQEFIDRAQYGRPAEGKGLPPLPVADYTLSYCDKLTGRGAYSFCMCPGGSVIAASSGENQLAINGMSYQARNSGIANAAIVVNVTPDDWGGDELGGIFWQEKYESLAYERGGGDFSAPVEAVGDFLACALGEKSYTAENRINDFCLLPTYRPSVKYADLTACLPPFVSQTLANALKYWNKKIKGYAAPDIPLTGIESRTSSPCRILRDRQSYMSLGLNGLYPIGEGAGYAGGIMSAALDGLKAVMAYLQNNYKNISGKIAIAS